MRESLIELLKQIDFDFSEECVCASEDGYKGAPDLAEFFADRLIAEGVIVPPCKVGDEIYWIGDKERVVKTFFVNCVQINIFDKHIHTVIHTVNNKENFYSDREFSNYQFGNTLFFTKEEAEKALERSENGKA